MRPRPPLGRPALVEALSPGQAREAAPLSVAVRIPPETTSPAMKPQTNRIKERVRRKNIAEL